MSSKEELRALQDKVWGMTIPQIRVLEKEITRDFRKALVSDEMERAEILAEMSNWLYTFV